MSQRDARGRFARGAVPWSKLNPQLMPRGADHRAHQRPESVLKGEKHPRHKLSEADVLAIRHRRQLGESVEHLALAFNVAKPTVYQIVTRRGWKHV